MTTPDRPLPWITVSLTAWTLVVALTPGAADALQLDRTPLAHGEWWRLATCHFTHWTADHLAWDLAGFALLGARVERCSRTSLVGTLAISGLAVTSVVMLCRADLDTYRGLSGVDSGLFACWAVTGLARAARTHRWRAAAWMAAAAGGFAAKTILEVLADTTVFVGADPLFIPVPLAHLAGAAAGLLIALAYSRSAKAAQVAAA